MAVWKLIGKRSVRTFCDVENVLSWLGSVLSFVRTHYLVKIIV